jgi:hypothetical protein
MCGIIMLHTKKFEIFNCYIHVGEREMGLGCQHFIEGPSLILVAIYDWSF